MDTSIPSSSVLAYETLTALNSNEDTFEVFLLTLLRAHSANHLGNTAEGHVTDIAHCYYLLHHYHQFYHHCYLLRY